MYSQCPDCHARFRVTAAQLRAAHGTVRCGRCGGAFDALVGLSDALPAAEPADDETMLVAVRDDIAAAAESGVPAEYHFSAADLEKVFIEARDWSPKVAAQEGQAAESEPEPLLLVDEPEGVEDITLEGEKIAIAAAGATEDVESDEFSGPVMESEGTATPLDFDLTDDSMKISVVDLEVEDGDATNRLRALSDTPASDDGDARVVAPRVVPVAAVSTRSTAAPSARATTAQASVSHASPDQPATVQPTSVVTPGVAASSAAAAARDWPLPAPQRAAAAPLTSGARAAERWAGATRDEPVDFDPLLEDDEAAPQQRPIPWWSIGSGILALLLVVQLTHHYRERLLRQPQIGPALRAIYEGLGMPVASTWDLNAFEIRQWGSAADAPANGQLNVRASVTNRAGFAQPFPLLRLEMEDRFGEPVAIRDFEPSEYLKDPSRGSRMLAAGEAAEAELDVVAPSADAVGYRLNVCMRDSDRSVHCATSPG